MIPSLCGPAQARARIEGVTAGPPTVDPAPDPRHNRGAPGRREQYQREVAAVERLKGTLAPGGEMVTAALRYVISHPAAPVAMPGAKSPEQARTNAAAGERELTADALASLRALL